MNDVIDTYLLDVWASSMNLMLREKHKTEENATDEVIGSYPLACEYAVCCARWPMRVSASLSGLFFSIFQTILLFVRIVAFLWGRKPPEKDEEQRRIDSLQRRANLKRQGNCHMLE